MGPTLVSYLMEKMSFIPRVVLVEKRIPTSLGSNDKKRESPRGI